MKMMPTGDGIGCLLSYCRPRQKQTAGSRGKRQKAFPGIGTTGSGAMVRRHGGVVLGSRNDLVLREFKSRSCRHISRHAAVHFGLGTQFGSGTWACSMYFLSF